MTLFQGSSSPATMRMLSVLRIVTGALFFEHGLQKVYDVPAAAQLVPYHPLSLLGVAGVIETIGGCLLLVGFFTRPTAFIASGEMAVAYFKVHIHRSFFPINNRGDNVVLFCFVMLYLVFAGGGVWSIDHWIARQRGANPLSRPNERTSVRPRGVDLEDDRPHAV